MAMNATWAILGPFAVVFAAALAIALIQRRTKDPCLKKLNRQFVLIQTRQKTWIAGCLQVLPKALVIHYQKPHSDPHGYDELSCILYEENIEEIRMILRPVPKLGTEEHQAWMRELEKIKNPSLARKFMRKLRILFNMVRDAFAQSMTMLVGVFKQKTPLSKIAGADHHATQVGQKLLTVIPNSYEPALELYLTKDVAVETIYDGQLGEQVGILQEYSDKFLLLSDVFFPELPEIQGLRDRDGRNQFTVIFPRKQAVVRHAVQRHEIAAPIKKSLEVRSIQTEQQRDEMQIKVNTSPVS